jgi:diaminopimelate epimerase
MATLPFVKMQGLGNDFIVIDGLSVTRPKLLEQIKLLKPEFARRICDRRFGIGADQILWIRPPKSKKAMARMEVINADGSIAEMCGNGIRAVALYLDELKAKKASGRAARAKIYSIETLAGILSVEVSGEQVRVDMGCPKFGSSTESAWNGPENLQIDGKSISFYEVSMGNPHAVILVENLASYPVEREGGLIEMHPRFPKRTNVEFVQVVNRGKVIVKVWERGAGLTLACGTGACASAVAAIAARKVKNSVEVHLPGGPLLIEWSGDPRHSVFMTGPAQEVFRGAIQS